MVQINLLGKKRKERSNRNWIIISMAVLFGGVVVYFLGITLYIVIRLYLIGAELKKNNFESVAISEKILANKDALTKYVLSKSILDRIDLLKSGRFRYRDYLNQVLSYLPPSAELSSVDFSTKGWVSVTVSSPNLQSLLLIENNLKNVSKLAQTDFASVYSESASVTDPGSYDLKLFFELKAK